MRATAVISGLLMGWLLELAPAIGGEPVHLPAAVPTTFPPLTGEAAPLAKPVESPPSDPPSVPVSVYKERVPAVCPLPPVANAPLPASKPVVQPGAPVQINFCLFNSGAQTFSRDSGRDASERMPLNRTVNRPDNEFPAGPGYVAPASAACRPEAPSPADGRIDGTITYTYYAGIAPSGPPLPGPPVDAGTYTVVATFHSNDGNYTGGSSATTFTIYRRNPVVSVQHPGGDFTGTPSPALAASATGPGAVRLPSPNDSNLPVPIAPAGAAEAEEVLEREVDWPRPQVRYDRSE